MDMLVGTDSDDAIGKQIGVSGSAVWERRRELGRPAITGSLGYAYPSTSMRGATYAALRAKGHSAREIAELYGVLMRTVQLAIRRFRARAMSELT